MAIYTVKASDGKVSELYGADGRCIAMQSDGTLWAVMLHGDPASSSGLTLAVYYSTDSGVTWTLSLESSSGDSRDTYQAISIAVDSSDNVHVIFHFIDYVDGYGDPTALYHTVFNGSSWSSLNTIVCSTTSVSQCTVYYFLIDRDDNLWVFRDNESNLRYYKSTNGGYDWSVATTIETKYKLSGIRLAACVDDNGDIHIVWEENGTYGTNIYNVRHVWLPYGSDTWYGEFVTTATKSSGYRRTPHSIVCTSGSEPTLYVAVVMQVGTYGVDCYRKDYGGSWTADGPDVPSPYGFRCWQCDLAIDKDNNVRLIGLFGATTANHDTYAESVKSGGSWSWNIWDTAGNLYGDGCSAMWANYPQIGGNPTNIVDNGNIVLFHDATQVIQVYMGGAIGINIYPSDALARVTGLIHRYSPGEYSLEIFMGDVKAEFDISDYYYGPGTGVPEEVPLEEPEEEVEEPSLEYYRWRNLAYQEDSFAGVEAAGKAGIGNLTDYYRWKNLAYQYPKTDLWNEPPVSSIYFTEEGDINIGSLYVAPEVYSYQKTPRAPTVNPFAGTKATGAAKPPTSKPSSSSISCPAGYVARYISGRWQCVPLYGGTTTQTYGGKAPPGGG